MSVTIARAAIAGAAGLSIWLIAAGIALNMTSSRLRRMRAIISGAPSKLLLQQVTAESILVAEIAAQPFRQRIIRPQWRRITRLALRYAPTRIITTLQRQLDGAGNPRKLAPHEYLVIKCATMVGGILAGTATVDVWFTGGGLRPALYVVACGVGGFMLPDVWLYDKRKRHLQELGKTLPDVVDLIRVSMDGGLSYDGAVSYAVAKVKNAFTHELSRYLIDRQIGRSTESAMHTMGNRSREPDLVRLVEVVVQGEALGTGINRALGAFSSDLRVKRRQRAEKKAHQASTKMLFPMILLILPAVFIIILGPTIPVITKSLGL